VGGVVVFGWSSAAIGTVGRVVGAGLRGTLARGTNVGIRAVDGTGVVGLTNGCLECSDGVVGTVATGVGPVDGTGVGRTNGVSVGVRVPVDGRSATPPPCSVDGSGVGRTAG